MKYALILLISVSTTGLSVFLKNKDASEVLVSKNKDTSELKQLTQAEWNNELLFNMRLTTYARWDDFLRPWSRFRVGKAIIKCKKQCMKNDKKGWLRGYKYEESFEPWKSSGFADAKRPIFPCSNCLEYFKVIKPNWKRIVKHMDDWVEQHSDSDY